MNWFYKALLFLQSSMETPLWFGWYHLFCLFLMIVLIPCIILFRKHFSAKSVRFILLGTSLLLLILETIKQLIYSFSWDASTNQAIWSYQWYAFPFQFCSTPMYLMLLASLFPKGKIQSALFSYLGTFALFAGLVVMIYPGDVFCGTTFINIQTMIWHASMVLIGVLLWSTGNILSNHSTMVKASIVFLIMLGIALLLNYIWVWNGGIKTGQTFNMFYISPFYPCTLPLLSTIYEVTPYILFFIVYVIGFMISASLIYLIIIAIQKCYFYISHTKKRVKQ